MSNEPVTPKRAVPMSRQAASAAADAAAAKKAAEEPTKAPEPQVLSFEQQQLMMANAVKAAVGPIATQLEALQADVEAAKTAKPEEPKPTMADQLKEFDEEKVDNLSNMQMLTAMCNAVETAISNNNNNLRADVIKDMTPALAKVNNLEKIAYGIVAQQGVAAARSKYDDFDQFAPEISKKMGEVPGLDFEDAYLLVKSKTPTRTQVETEKPSSNAVVPSGRTPAGRPPGMSDMEIVAQRGRESRGMSAKRGVGLFREIVAEALERTVTE